MHVLVHVALKPLNPEGVVDNDIEKVAKFRRSASAKRRGQNAARDLHGWAHRSKTALPVPITTTDIPVLQKRRNKTGARKVIQSVVSFPVLRLSNWFLTLMSMFPKFFLGGFDISETDEYESMFAEFWRNYATCHPSHPVYEKSEEDQKRCIPIALHGDEGRSLAKVPLLVISYQVLIPYTGPNDLSLARYPRCKMIPSCIHVPIY